MASSEPMENSPPGMWTMPRGTASGRDILLLRSIRFGWLLDCAEASRGIAPAVFCQATAAGCGSVAVYSWLLSEIAQATPSMQVARARTPIDSNEERSAVRLKRRHFGIFGLCRLGSRCPMHPNVLPKFIDCMSVLLSAF